MTEPVAKHRRLSFAVKYGTVLFPFDGVRFVQALSREGFTVPESVDTEPLTRTLLVGTFRRADVSVRIDMQRYILGVRTPTVESLVQQMDAVESMLVQEFGLKSSALAQYYEFLADATVKAQKNPLEKWNVLMSDAMVLDRFGKMLGAEIAPFGLRLTRRGERPNQAEWMELRVEPLIESPTDYHFVELVFRHPERTRVVQTAVSFEQTIKDIVAIVEA